ncbi:hypothetical protein J3R30DRAFT_1466726 [Lentinula aciculospora]|uniref:Uncharacterized protein n=1 Tax=Lentinula aciculospora TaxID=153920 RepID=A0A9W9DU27_9AGAR|nr:hypothetical protein J3R30DRAFT_1466726 [Lentinula aciculospora]
MGSLCSKPSTHSGGHTVLGSTSDNNNDASRMHQADPRAAAAEAAERRLKASQMRGTHSSNPSQGKLAAQASKPAKLVPEPQREERIVLHAARDHRRRSRRLSAAHRYTYCIPSI